MTIQKTGSSLTLSLNIQLLPAAINAHIDSVNNGKPLSSSTKQYRTESSQSISEEFANHPDLQDKELQFFIHALLLENNSFANTTPGLFSKLLTIIGAELRCYLPGFGYSIQKSSDNVIKITAISPIEEFVGDLNVGSFKLELDIFKTNKNYQIKIKQADFTFSEQAQKEKFIERVVTLPKFKHSFYQEDICQKKDIYQEKRALLSDDSWCELLGLKDKKHLRPVLDQLFEHSVYEYELDELKDIVQKAANLCDFIKTLKNSTYHDNGLIQAILEAPLLIARFEQVYDKNAQRLAGLQRSYLALPNEGLYNENEVPTFVKRQFNSLQKEQATLLKNPFGLKYSWLEKIFIKPIEKLLLQFKQWRKEDNLSKVSLRSDKEQKITHDSRANEPKLDPEETVVTQAPVIPLDNPDDEPTDDLAGAREVTPVSTGVPLASAALLNPGTNKPVISTGDTIEASSEKKLASIGKQSQFAHVRITQCKSALFVDTSRHNSSVNKPSTMISRNEQRVIDQANRRTLSSYSPT